MNIEFQWVQQPNVGGKESLENEITGILQERDINPCHPGSISVSLGIFDPLDNNLQGSAKCQCGKTLMTFEGDSNASNLKITEFEQLK